MTTQLTPQNRHTHFEFDNTPTCWNAHFHLPDSIDFNFFDENEQENIDNLTARNTYLNSQNNMENTNQPFTQTDITQH